MTGKEKILAAFSAEGTPEIPAVIPYYELYVSEALDRLTSQPWWHVHAPDLERQVAWNAEVIENLGQDWVQVFPWMSSEESDSFSLDEREDGVYRVDRRTGEETELVRPCAEGSSSDGESISVHPEQLAASCEELDRVVPDPPVFDPAEFAASGRGRLAEALLNGPVRGLFPVSRVSAPLWSCYGFWGFEGMMTMVATEPEVVKYACERVLGHVRAGVQVAAALGAQAIWIEDCLMDQISPVAYREIAVPFVRRLVDEIHSVGCRSIYYYCGDPSGRWEDILSTGTDALALEEGKKGFEIDIEDVVDKIQGRCTLLGNLDSIGVLQDGTDEELRAEVRRQIAAGRKNGSRFIMSIGSPVTPGTPPERVRLYCDLVREMG